MGVGGGGVVRIRATFGVNAAPPAAEGYGDVTKPFNPKRITYEITGSAGGVVGVDYLDENGQPHAIDAARLPWSYTIVTTLPSMSANIVAQGDTDVRALRCRVIVDDRVRDDRRSDEYRPFIYCLVKTV
ncbi:MmpS family transport accessory protein [Mycobacterium arosiense]|uniref:MmpS family protein n=1 Tax=Mycobacterium arosiense ATCC BAA-1401 = DSM 45069 TaxID=1265311 RepID=A0A1W9ZC69_MYCAI|nr:MmpS family transport accessory protein [Mycobacterium arosiense]ORA11295.1 MmpS family protein [Mycobacterium arosiense ATCC BAA-1401 = DSM 45069]